MPDITMCRGAYIMETEINPVCKECYRRTATPSEYRQSFFVSPPILDVPDSNSCEYFWKDVK